MSLGESEGTDGSFTRPTDPLRPRSRREAVEFVGLLCTALLAAVMLSFVALYWLRESPVGAQAYGQFMIAGQWIDLYLGTRVFRHPFMWQSLATGVLIGIVAPMVGTFVVHREMALIGETLAHTAFAGVAVGLLVTGFFGLSGSLLLVALVVSVLGALGLQWLIEHTNSYGDVPIAIMLSGSFAVGTLLISWGRDFMSVTIDIEAYLFGQITVVTADGARLMALLSVVVVAVVVYNYKQLLFVTFDEQAASVAGLHVRWYNALLIVMTAVVVVGAMQILGVILVAAMLVVPVAAASQVATSFRETLVLSILFGQLSILLGFAFSVRQGLPAGGSIVVVAIAIYLLSIVLSDRSVNAISVH
ncbi:metal ABC transporter permease [Natronorarus salvus]|uniref:metal ABC transporter permease n=1 Tax=Natronorarus salvus TaxID=3117733 RepID=UPI002F26AEE0